MASSNTVELALRPENGSGGTGSGGDGSNEKSNPLNNSHSSASQCARCQSWHEGECKMCFSCGYSHLPAPCTVYCGGFRQAGHSQQTCPRAADNEIVDVELATNAGPLRIRATPGAAAATIFGLQRQYAVFGAPQTAAPVPSAASAPSDAQAPTGVVSASGNTDVATPATTESKQPKVRSEAFKIARKRRLKKARAKRAALKKKKKDAVVGSAGPGSNPESEEDDENEDEDMPGILKSFDSKPDGGAGGDGMSGTQAVKV